MRYQGGAVRYFDEHKDEKPATFVCKNCRAQGQHRTFECPVQIVSNFLVATIDVIWTTHNDVFEVFDLWCKK